MSHRVVRARPQWQVHLMRLGVVLAVVLAAWGLYEYGRFKGGYDVVAAQQQTRQQQKQLAALEQETTHLREQKAILERSSQIEQEAYRQLEGTVNGLQDEILELKEELAFYRGIVSPGDAKKGLNLQSFNLTPLREARKYRFKMVLTQVLSNGNVAYGNISFSVEGREAGKDKEYTLSQLSDNDKELRFRFKYFQAFEGDLSLPEGFIPSKVNLVVKPRSRKHKQLTESIDWMVQES
jgi:cell division protein FtsB